MTPRSTSPISASPTSARSRPSIPPLPVIAAAVTLVLWASAFVGIRHVGESVSPGALSLGRLVVAALCLTVMVLVQGRGRLPALPMRRSWPLLLTCGVAWFGSYNLTLNAAERHIDAGTAALILQVGNLWVALMAAAFFAEPLHRYVVLGMVVGFSGVALIAVGADPASSGDHQLLGIGLALLSSLGYGVGTITQKRLLVSYPALTLIWWATTIGMIMCLPWAGDLVHTVRTVDAATLGWLVYLGIFPSAIAFTTWAYALSRSNASTLSLTTFLVPVLATAMAWALLDEVPPELSFVGGVLAIAGVAISRRKPAATAHAS